jgi:hypothetical protein
MNIRHSVSSRSDAELSAEIAALRAKVEQARSPPLIEAQAEVPGDQHADLQHPAGPLSSG